MGYNFQIQRRVASEGEVIIVINVAGKMPDVELLQRLTL